MDRREFTKLGLASGIAVCLGESKVVSASQAPQVAITMDDFNWDDRAGWREPYLGAGKRDRTL